MTREIKFNIRAHDLLKRGVGQLSDVVKVALGPKGRNVIISRSYGIPRITKDGVTVAREIELEDEFENMGAQFVHEVASKTNKNTGDGTTTTTALTQGVINMGLKNITSGTNPMKVERGADKAVKAVAGSTHKQAKGVSDSLEQTAHVATISVSGDEGVGQLIAWAAEKVREEGIITIKEVKDIDTTVDIVEGIQFDNGYISPYFVTDTEKMECRMKKPYILFYEERLSTIKDLLPLLEKALQQDCSLLTVAEDTENEALTTLVLNGLRAGLGVCDVKAPGFGDRRKKMLRDMAILTGDIVISEDTDLTLESATIDTPGNVETVTTVKNKTTTVNDDGDREAIAGRVN